MSACVHLLWFGRCLRCRVGDNLAAADATVQRVRATRNLRLAMSNVPVMTRLGTATPELQASAHSRPSQLPAMAGPHAGGVASRSRLPAAPAGTAGPERAPRDPHRAGTHVHGGSR